MSRPGLAHFSPLLLSLLLGLPNPSGAQAAPDALEHLALRLAAFSAVTGYEHAAGDTLLHLLPGSVRDPLGSIVRRGSGSARRLVACPLDEPGWIVGGVRPDGWLTVRRTPGPAAPRRDQQLEGARVTVFGHRPVPAVVAVRSIHLTRGRDDLSAGPFTADSALVDLGAASAAEVARLGVGVLAPVTLAKRPHRYGAGLIAAPWMARRGACAAVLHAALGRAGRAVTVAFVAQHELGARGLAALARRAGPFDATLVVDAEAAVVPGAMLPSLGRASRLTLPARYPGSPVETVAMTDLETLAAAITAWIEEGR